MPSFRPYLEGLIDYAGLFPPAELDMAEAVRCYAEYRRGRDHDLLGRFVLPASRLDEFADAARPVLDRGRGSVPWCLSVIADRPVATVRRAMLEFTAQHMSDAKDGHALCDAVEMRLDPGYRVPDVVGTFSSPLRVFLEIPLTPGYERKIAIVADNNAAAKIRTGGTTADAFPGGESIVRFITACNGSNAPFKATAGLHHAVCGTYPLTYARNSDRARMFGFMNVLLASAFIRNGIDERSAIEMLECDSLDEFDLQNSRVRWREHELKGDDLRLTRSQFFLSFGSCSFSEPVEEARALGLI